MSDEPPELNPVQCINYGPSCFRVHSMKATPLQTYVEAPLNVEAYEALEQNTVYPALRFITADGEELRLEANMLESLKLDLEPSCEPMMTMLFGLPLKEDGE